MTDYILSKIKGKVLLLSVSVDNFGLISATFHVNGKEAVSVSGVTLEELNASFDTYMGNETFEAAKPAKVVVKEKKAAAPKQEKPAEKAVEKEADPIHEETDGDDTPPEEPTSGIPSAPPPPPKEAPKKVEPVKEVKPVVKESNDDDDFNF